jgi:hypothetical protein
VTAYGPPTVLLAKLIAPVEALMLSALGAENVPPAVPVTFGVGFEPVLQNDVAPYENAALGSALTAKAALLALVSPGADDTILIK